METLSAPAIRRALELRDLTDPRRGPHAMQLLQERIEQALAARWSVPVRRERAHPVVSVAENYDRLLIAPDAVAREARYTRYLNEDAILRTHSSAIVPPALDRLSAHPPDDVVLSCPGICYRREGIDRYRVGEPHQLDLWRIRTVGPALGRGDLEDMIGCVVAAGLPQAEWRLVRTGHPYTIGGVQIDVSDGSGWVEIGECGVAAPNVLTSSGLRVPPASGLAMGLGLDRLLMLAKGIPDIRLLRSTDPRVAEQMQDLAPYRPVSSMPAVKRDLSVAVHADATSEEVGDRVRGALGDASISVESVEVVTETLYAALPAAARTRLGMSPGQKNLLLRVVVRDLERTLTDEDANEIRDRIYEAVHEGREWTWAAARRRHKRGPAVRRDAETQPS
jgi:phenylalanyl-tRNA synthetase alpha chain